MQVLILSSCTGKKEHKPDNQLTKADFQVVGKNAFHRREKALAAYRLPAGEMYTGQQHVRLLRGIELMRKACPEVSIDLKIVSAGYGLIDEATPIVPYEMTFQGMRAKELRKWAHFLELPQNVLSVIPEYDLIIFLLGKEYLRTIDLPKDLHPLSTCIFLTSKGGLRYIPEGSNVLTYTLSNKDAQRMGAGLVALKGKIIEIIGGHVHASGPKFLEGLKQSPESLIEFIRKYKKPAAASRISKTRRRIGRQKTIRKDSDALLKADYDSRVIQLSKEWLSKAHRKKMRYFIPEWDDLVNPNYDFKTDTHPDGTGDSYEFAYYAHQIFDTPPYDGIIVSKVIVESKKSKKAILETLGVHRYLRVPREFPIMGDCGAFGYIMEEVPPYETDEILDYYQGLDFDYGVSIDHLIVNAVLKKTVYLLIQPDGERHEVSPDEYQKLRKSNAAKEVRSLKRQRGLFDKGPCLYRQETLDDNEKLRRYELTINNAQDFIEKHRAGKYVFTPIGAAQGWSPESYADAVKAYQDMGYTYVALGGLVRTPTKGILEVLEEVRKVLKPSTDLHLFGVARPDVLTDMHRLGVTSIDSATFLRRAWLGASSNYFTQGQKYAAIRIPQAEKSPRAKKIVREGKASLEEVKDLEKSCLKLVRAYDKDAADIDTVLDAVMTYDELMGENRNGHRELIRKTLEDRPWKHCTCTICKDNGVEVIIFRGNNRNRRRGFHNTKFFYDQFCTMFGTD